MGLSLRWVIAAVVIFALLTIVLPVLIFGIGTNEPDKGTFQRQLR